MRILFLHSGNESFVKIDRELLAACFDVHDFHAIQKFPMGLMNYLQGIRECDLLFGWFASWNSFWALLLSKLFRKSSILIIGGYDIANLPAADYGHQRGGLEKIVSRLAMQLADHLLPFSDFSQQEAVRNVHVPEERMDRIYLGVPDVFGALPADGRQRMALTVGNVEWPNIKRKGLEPFVRTAAHLPEVQFVLAGAWKDDSITYLRSIASSNVLFTGRLSEEELESYYRKSSVYIQPSLHEGFGLSVAEAMLAGCIPVVTKAGSLPEVVGDCGQYCESNSPDQVAQAIRLALNSSFEDRVRARERILTEFPLQQRKTALLRLIDHYETSSHA